MRSLGSKVAVSIKSLIVAALVLGGSLLLAFGPRAGEELPADRVIVDYWEHWSGAEEAGMRAIVNAFNDTVGREKKIFVRYLSTSSIEQKTLVATAAGVPPDIAGLYDQNIAQFAALDALEPLDDLAAEHGITSAHYKKVFWEACRYEGRLYGLVSSAFDLALFYNKRIMRERADELRARGLDPDRPPQTIDELDAYSEALDRTGPGGRLEVAGFLPLEPGWYKKYYGLWFGARWWDEKARRFTFTDPGMIRAFTWVQSYSKKHPGGSETTFRSGLGAYDSPQNAFLAGRVVMELQGMFLANVIRTQAPRMKDDWAAAAFPSAVPGLNDVTYCNADVLVIPRGSKKKREAFEFIAFVNRQDQMETLANSHGKISPLASVSESFLANHTNPYIRVFDRLASSPNARPTEPVPILPEVNAEMENFIQRLSLLEVTPEEGLKDLQDRLQKKYDDFMREQNDRRRRSS